MNGNIPTDIFCSSVTGLDLRTAQSPQPKPVPLGKKFQELTTIDRMAIDPQGAMGTSLWAKTDWPHFNDELIDESNNHAIEETMAQYVEAGEAIVDRDSHLYVKVWTGPDKLETTEAYGEMLDILNKLEDYPLLDFEDHSEREIKAEVEAIELDFKNLVRDDAPEGWAYLVSRWYGDAGDMYLHSRQDEDTMMEALRDLQLANPDALYGELEDDAAIEAVDDLNRAIEMSAKQFAEYKQAVPTPRINELRKQLVDNIQKLKDQRMDILLHGLSGSARSVPSQMMLPGFQPKRQKPGKKEEWQRRWDREKKKEELRTRQEMEGKSKDLIEEELAAAEATYDQQMRQQKLVQLKARLQENKRIRDAISDAIAHLPEPDIEEIIRPEPGTDLFASTFIRFPA